MTEKSEKSEKTEKQLVDELKAAREHGDLRENAEYHAAREALALHRSHKEAAKQAKKDAEDAEHEHKKEKNHALQELLDTGMTLEEIKMTMPWMVE